MATLGSRWLLSILLVIVPKCFAPAPPSLPECCIPCGEEKDNCVNIRCDWDSGLNKENHTYYSLHWKSANSEEVHVINGTSTSWIICRKDYTHGELRVWVQHGSVKSQAALFNTADIIKLPPPKVSSVSHQEFLDISWNSTCDEQQLSLGHCDVRYRTEEEQVWLEDKEVLHGSYTVDSPQPGTVYEFQVRCSCVPGLMSDWSLSHSLPSTEAAPDGELDVWRDCGISQKTSDCVVTWKKLPISQARGLILGYEVRLSYNNGTAVLVNVSTAEPKGRLACEEMQCHFTPSLKNVSSVSVSAYNTLGATVPSDLAMPTKVKSTSSKQKNERAIHLVMNEENLNVSWDPPAQLSDNLKEYVVQYKQAGSPPGQGFGWIKVKNLTTGIFEGRYKKYTPFQVSLFTLSHSSKVHHLSSVIGYSLQGTPSRVPSFKVESISDTHVTLFWESIPLSQQSGVILYYQIIVESGADRQNVLYNVSVSPQQDSETFKLLHLSPGQQYEVRIRAVTAAGPGANETAKFEMKDHENFAHLIAVVLGTILLAVICILLVLYSACRENKAWCISVSLTKVPDARNSHIFRHMKHQINDSLAWICIPVNEPHPKISLLEVVEKTSDPDELTRLVVGHGCPQVNCQDDRREGAVPEDCHGTDHSYGRKDYSHMVDSDEERHREDSCSSSEEEQSVSGYEKHFMPTALEVLEV
ncbi:interleukin 12 receptor, beta 2a, like [Cebidichthys violaceus]|uniref:interleukin 12 receptor, beta 2a, like n=1 Tax=Cebidichthys violaceus TaxID=271503 RepID=UPI0035CA4273